MTGHDDQPTGRLDTAKLGNLALALIDQLAEDYGEVPDIEIGMVAIVVELAVPDASGIAFRCSDARRWVQAGLFERARTIAAMEGDG